MREKKGKKEKPTDSKATVTKLVMNIFNSMFQEQIDGEMDNKGDRKRRCGICEVGFTFIMVTGKQSTNLIIFVFLKKQQQSLNM